MFFNLSYSLGIVTRRPLILQLLHTDQVHTLDDEEYTEWAQFLHLSGEVFTDFECVKQEIINDTERVAGGSKGISDVPIHLKIYSQNIPNLTLVDLPGLTKVPVLDQPEDIETQIHELVLKYVENENTIILAISPGNQDIANSDALKVARTADPYGDRTLAVITKVDLMEKGTEAMNLLKGHTLPVKLGIIGVVNRSQKDINAGKSIPEAIRKEEDFFNSYHPMLASEMGTSFLSKRLCDLLMKHVKKCLPLLRTRVSQLKGSQEAVIGDLGSPIDKKGPAVLNCINTFAEEFKGVINGSSTHLDTTEISGGAKLFYIFQVC